MRALRQRGRQFTRNKVEQMSLYMSPSLALGALANSLRRRAAHHIKHLLDLIKQFPTINPPVSDDSDLDIPKLFGQIRSRYKALCSTLGVRSDLRAANETSPLREQANEMDTLETGRQDNTVWKLDSQPKKPAVGSLDF